jgi:hypothetical protein
LTSFFCVTHLRIASTGSSIVGLPMSFLDVCIGAGAKSVKKDNPVSIALFVFALILFVSLICFVGSRAKKKLMALDQEDTNEEADEELAGLNADDEESEEEVYSDVVCVCAFFFFFFL